MQNFSVHGLLQFIFSVQVLELLFYTASGLQIMFWAWELIGSKAWADNSRANPISFDENSFPACSIVICARNEADQLQRNLPAILAQAYPGIWELVVVDDASKDGTAGVLEKFRQHHPRLRTVRIEDKIHPGKKQALEAGIHAARYDHILLTDADCRPASTKWAAAMVAKMTSHPATRIVLGYGPISPEAGFLNQWIRFETDYTAILYFSVADAGMPYMGVGRNLAYHRDIFLHARGFAGHTNLVSGDDDLLINQAAAPGNTAICLDSDAFMYSAGITNWASWFRQKRRQLGAGPYYRPEHRFILGLILGSHVCHYGVGALLILSGFSLNTVAAWYGIRLVIVLASHLRIKTILMNQVRIVLIPLFDGMLALYGGLYLPWVYLNGRHRPVLWK